MPTIADPNEAPTELAPSTPVVEEGETPSIPETPHLQPEDGALPPADTAAGIATRIEGREVMTQTPPLLSRLIQGYLDQTGIAACPYHQMDHGVRDPHCDHCKRALGPLYHHKIVGNRHLPVFTFDFSGPHPRKVNMAQYLLVAVWSLGHMRLLWAFGVESRQTSVVLPCLQSCFENLCALTGGSRPPILRLHSDKASEFLSPPIRAYLSQQGVCQTVNSGYDPQAIGLAERWIGIVKVRATALLADVRLHMLVVGSLTCIRTESQKSQSIRLSHTSVMSWSSTTRLRSRPLLRIVDLQECVWVMTPVLLVVFLLFL